MATFNFPALLDRQIRVLMIEPGSIQDSVSSLLAAANLDDIATKYTALSYCREDQKPSQPIQCNRTNILVTQNVHDALVALRSPHWPVYLWVDQICIDQANMAERNQQVALMGDVYKRAHRVTIWLGQSDGYTETAFRALSSLAEIHDKGLDRLNGLSVCQSRAIGDNREQAQAPEPKTPMCSDLQESVSSLDIDLNQLLMMPSTRWESIASILSHPRFGRMWPFQEAVLGDRLTQLQRGEFVLEIKVLTSAARVLSRCGYDTAIGPDHPAYLGLCVSHYIGLMRSNMHQRGRRDPLHTLLSGTRSFRCSDSHDKVYAILGLCRHEYHEFIGIDYQMSLTQLYSAVVKASISVERNLCILSLVQHDDINTLTRPSWIPDIDDPHYLYAFDFGRRGNEGGRYYRACSETSSTPPSSNNPLHLDLQGIRFQEITRLLWSNRSVYDYSDLLGWHERYRMLAQRMDISIPSDVCNMRPSVLEHDYLIYSDGYSTQHPTHDDIIGAIIRRAATADVYPCASKKRYHDEHVKVKFPAFWEWRGTGFKGDVPFDVLLEHTRFEDKVMQNRCFCIVGEEPNKSFLCVAPVDAEVGDLVCVLFGGDVPVLLRERKDSSQNATICNVPSRWQLVGECFVDGIMDGEALDGKTVDDFETFVLI